MQIKIRFLEVFFLPPALCNNCFIFGDQGVLSDGMPKSCRWVERGEIATASTLLWGISFHPQGDQRLSFGFSAGQPTTDAEMVYGSAPP